MIHIEDSGEEAEQEEACEKVCAVFNKAFVEGVEPFKGDLENDTYKELLDVFRTFKPAEWTITSTKFNQKVYISH